MAGLTVALVLAGASGTGAATLTVVHTFGGADGWRPLAGLIQGLDGKFYGTTHGGGNNTNCPGGCGTVFQMTSAGSVTTLYSFGPAYLYNGLYPDAWGLVQGSDSNFYGTTGSGGVLHSDGTTYNGNVFKLDAFGNYVDLCDFALSAAAPLLGADGSLYGTTLEGGSGSGNVFRTTIQGGLSNLYSFAGGSEGGEAFSGVVRGNDGTLYGTTYAVATLGGTDYFGTVYSISPAGVLTTLWRFTDGTDGAYPAGGLVLANDGNLYGMTQHGGAGRAGTVYQITPAGTLTTLHSFSGPDGAIPGAALIQGNDGNLYGTTIGGGTNGPYGTVFQISTSGVFTSLHQFSGTADGANPRAPLLQGNDGFYYGTTQAGGTNSQGSVFRLSVP